MIAVGILFYVLAWLTAGTIVTLFLRFRGLPDIAHNHHSECYEGREDNYYDYGSKKQIVTHRKRVCDPRLGGEPFQLILWLFWTIVWPIPVIASAIGLVAYLFFKLLWIEF